ncbi:MAG: hypothetical protein VW600_00440 [Ferrovibrio sp.]
MSVENVSAGLAGVARVSPQRPVKNALISNTDNPAVQQYAQVSRFTGYLTDTPPEQTEAQQNPNSGSASGSSYSSTASGTSETPVLNYGRTGSTTPVEKPNVVGQFLSVVA